jgi:hypothetical protein
MIPDSEIRPEIVRAYADHMSRAYGATIAPKASSAAMKAAGAFLRAFGFGLGARWETHVVTTMGRTIFVPFDLGVGGVWSPWEQIATIAHECQHVHDGTAGGLARDLGYLFSTSDRTHAEATAVVTSMELHWWRYGTIERWWTRTRAEALHGYGVSDADVEHIFAHLLAAAPTVRRGGFVSHVGETAIAWLDANAPELRAPNVRSRGAS